MTTKAFLSHFGFDTLRDLPDMEMLENAGLLSKEKMLAGDVPIAGTGRVEEDDVEIVDSEFDRLPGAPD